MQLRLGRMARQELAHARAWYGRISPLLGRRFAAEMRAASARIERNPLAYPLDLGDTRKCALNVFPYTLHYAVRGSVLLVVAVSHQNREPDYWTDRLPEPDADA